MEENRFLLSKGVWGKSSYYQEYTLEDNLYLSPGSVIGIYGGSGYGKSTFAEQLVDHFRKTGVSVSYLSQDLPFFSALSCAKNAKTLSQGGKIDYILSKLPLYLRKSILEKKEYSTYSLSGGQQRILALACALYQQTDLVILDESLISMDPNLLNIAMKLIRDSICNSKKRVLLISHDNMVIKKCDKIYSIKIHEKKRIISESERSDLNSDSSIIMPPPSTESTLTKNAKKNKNNPAILLTHITIAILFSFWALFSLFNLSTYSSNKYVKKMVPNFSDLILVLQENSLTLIDAFIKSFTTAFLSFLLALGLAALYWTVGWFRSTLRSPIIFSWVALQAVPVVVVSPLIVLMLSPPNYVMDLFIGVFISIFPLGLTGVFSFSAIDDRVYRVYPTNNPLMKFIIALKHSKLSLLRSVVVCSPLPVIGVIVSEFLVSNSGLGSLLGSALNSSGSTMDFSFVVSISIICEAIALIFISISILTATRLLPKDVSLI